jgi:hypothetical protein
MARITLDLDRETYRYLQAAASAERRPLPWQAEVLLRQALGLPFPYPDVVDATAEPERAAPLALPGVMEEN